MLLKKIFTSLFLGSSIGTGPYLMATQLPNSGVVKAQDEDVGFGKRCLLDQEICDFMAETEFKQDQENVQKEENPYITPALQEKLKKDWQSFLTERDDDYCGFGFYGYKSPETVKTEGKKERNVNNLEACYKFLIEQQKKKKKR